MLAEHLVKSLSEHFNLEFYYEVESISYGIYTILTTKHISLKLKKELKFFIKGFKSGYDVFY